MSTPNPLVPQDALEGASAPKSRIRFTILTILILHVVFIGGLLLQGCNNNTGSGAGDSPTNRVTTLPPLHDTNYFSSFPGDTLGAGSPPPPIDPEPYRPPSYSQVPPAIPPAVEVPPSIPSYSEPPPLRIPPPSILPPPTIPATEHVIQRGDTIGALARKYGVSEKAIMDANPGVQPRALKIDDRLKIPPAAPPSAPRASAPAAPPVPPGGSEYVVRSGDTLSRIASKHGVTVNALRTANNIRGDRILPNQRLIIPPKAPTTSGTSGGGRSY
ncbi:MAG: LysM peptidoglycan-binding domain-containing protein [Verrucomicrobiae bacterium]|nr:LysM peptidoglycan-binding domain-containing protein [Verrucomicrobiae bacterium]